MSYLKTTQEEKQVAVKLYKLANIINNANKKLGINDQWLVFRDNYTDGKIGINIAEGSKYSISSKKAMANLLEFSLPSDHRFLSKDYYGHLSNDYGLMYIVDDGEKKCCELGEEVVHSHKYVVIDQSKLDKAIELFEKHYENTLRSELETAQARRIAIQGKKGR